MSKLPYIEGLGHVMKNFAIMEFVVNDEFEMAAKKSRKKLFDRMRQNASLADHTLADLRKMGHPYAKANPQSIHSPDYLVHKQSGTLYDAIEEVEEIVHDGGTLIDVGINESKAPHAKNVIFGTSVMVGRDFVTGSFEEVGDDINEVYGRALTNIIKRDP